jgi:cytidine deaminase
MRACALASAFPQCRLYEQGYALENVARRACRTSLLKASCSGQLGAGGADHHTPTTRTGEDNNVVVDLSQSTPKGTTLGLEGKMVLPSERVEQLKEEFGMTADELITALITPASTMARPPISSFKVGAVGIGGSGDLYVGCNLEFAKLPLYNSVHAEQFLLVNALHHGEESIEKLAISAAPCGHCRQFFSELDCADRIKFLFFGGSYSLGQLLPMRFKPQDLLDVGSVPLLLKPQDNRVAFTAASLAKIQEWEELGERKLV